MINKYGSFYVERDVKDHKEWLRVKDWYFWSWSGCFCLLEDRDTWT